MRRRILTATAALTLLLIVSMAPADASVFGTPRRQSLELQDLVSWVSSWFTGVWDGDADPTNPTDPAEPTDPTTDDDRGHTLDPDG